MSASSSENYYNSFYKDLAKLDEAGNSYRKIEAFVPALPASAKVLDVGCGHGSVSVGLVERGFTVYGLETNRDCINSLRKKGITPIEVDLNQKFELKQNFDLILLLDVLEHMFDPVELLLQCKAHLSERGKMIISVPLYFDLMDRLRILFTGSVVSYDNLVYGVENYRKFRSFNYDHIRFFRPKEILELCKQLDLTVEVVEYGPMWGTGPFSRIIARVLANRYTLKRWPNLLAHSMTLRVTR